MSEPVVPPPIASPPPPPTNQRRYAPPAKPRSNWLLYFLLGLALLLGAGTVLGIGLWVSRLTQKVITPPPLAGKPQIVRSLAGGWVEARFPEFPLSVELPGEPEAVPFKSQDLGAHFNMVCNHFVCYVVPGEGTNAHLYGYWMNMLGMASVTDSEMRSFATGFSEAEGTTKIIELKGVSPEVVATHYRSRQDNVYRDTVNLFRRHRQAVLVISIESFSELDARETASRIGRTLQFK